MKLPSFPIFSGKKKDEDNFNPFPDLPPKHKSKKFKIEYLVLGFSIIIFSASIFLLINNKNLSDYISSKDNSLQEASLNLTQTIPTPTPKLIPTGKQIYRYSHGDKVTGPKPSQLIIDPIDPEIGDAQTLTIVIPHDKPITNIQVTLITDNQTKDLKLKEVSPTTWQAKWTSKDSYEYTYKFKLLFQDEAELFSGDHVIR